MARNTGNLLETDFSDERCATTPTDDTTPPDFGGVYWEIEPIAIKLSPFCTTCYGATMTAAEATDDSGVVEYFFECTYDDKYSSDSDGSDGWQTERTYTTYKPIGAKGHSYPFRVGARDKYGNESWSPVVPTRLP